MIRRQELSVSVERRTPTPGEHRSIAEAVGWDHAFNWDSLPRSLERSLCGAVALAGEVTVGMGRVVGDGTMYFYIQDVAVLPAWQGRGVGRAIVEDLLDQVRELAPGRAFTGLFATPDALPLYRQLGFAEGDLHGLFRVVEPCRRS